MTDRPILFSAPMVRALLAGRKTQTRRILKPPYGTLEWLGNGQWRPIYTKVFSGDRLWVRESFSYETLDVDQNGFMPPWYWADGNPVSGEFTRPKPSIHMPRWASRLTLTVTDVRVERLQDISEADATAEGIEAYTTCGDPSDTTPAADAFMDLWIDIHGPDAWDKNPWVAAISFDVHRGNIDRPNRTAPDARTDDPPEKEGDSAAT